MITPIIKVTKSKQSKSFYTLQDYQQWKDETANASSWNIKYYKGLGTSNTSEAKDYFKHILKNNFIWTEESNINVDLAFKKDVNLTTTRRGITYKYTTRITELKEDGFASVSDIVDALTRGTFQSNYHMWGHGERYYIRRGSVPKEIFANLFAIRHNEKAYNLAKKYIPNTVEEFEKRLLELERL